MQLGTILLVYNYVIVAKMTFKVCVAKIRVEVIKCDITQVVVFVCFYMLQLCTEMLTDSPPNYKYYWRHLRGRKKTKE